MYRYMRLRTNTWEKFISHTSDANVCACTFTYVILVCAYSVHVGILTHLLHMRIRAMYVTEFGIPAASITPYLHVQIIPNLSGPNDCWCSTDPQESQSPTNSSLGPSPPVSTSSHDPFSPA